MEAAGGLPCRRSAKGAQAAVGAIQVEAAAARTEPGHLPAFVNICGEERDRIRPPSGQESQAQPGSWGGGKEKGPLTTAGHVGWVEAVALIAGAGEPVGDLNTLAILTATQDPALLSWEPSSASKTAG